jgi:hypothetical protein
MPSQNNQPAILNRGEGLIVFTTTNTPGIFLCYTITAVLMIIFQSAFGLEPLFLLSSTHAQGKFPDQFLYNPFVVPHFTV